MTGEGRGGKGGQEIPLPFFDDAIVFSFGVHLPSSPFIECLNKS